MLTVIQRKQKPYLFSEGQTVTIETRTHGKRIYIVTRFEFELEVPSCRQLIKKKKKKKRF